MRDTSVDVLKIVQAGYAVVHQDVRGAGASEGHYRPFLDDRQDGVDTLAWAQAQSWSNGELGMMGISYTAGTQWLAAIETPPNLKAIAPHSFHHDPYLGWLYQGGAFSLGFADPLVAELLLAIRERKRGVRRLDQSLRAS